MFELTICQKILNLDVYSSLFWNFEKISVVYLDKSKKKIYVANAGDSRCVMGKNGVAVEMSIDHKPENEIEINRITKSGSTITEGRVDGNLNLTRSLRVDMQ